MAVVGRCCSPACGCCWRWVRWTYCCRSSPGKGSSSTAGRSTVSCSPPWSGQHWGAGGVDAITARRYLTVMMLLWGLGSAAPGGRRRDVVVPGDGAGTVRSGLASGVAWSSGARCCSAGCPADARPGRQSGLLRLAVVHAAVDGRGGPLSKVVPVQVIFAAAGSVPGSSWRWSRSPRHGCPVTRLPTRWTDRLIGPALCGCRYEAGTSVGGSARPRSGTNRYP